MAHHIPPHLPADGKPGSLTNDDWDVIARAPLFAGCPEDARARIADFAYPRHLAHGSFLLQPGEPNDHVYIVVEGQLAAYRDAGLQQALARFVPGDCLGEHALIAPDGGTTYVAAQWPSRLIAIRAAALRELIDEFPRIAVNVLDMLGARLRAANLRPPVEDPAYSIDFSATHDAVTGLHNRRWMSETFQGEIAHAVRASEQAHLVLLDIDQFDRLNQALGRHAGDSVLRQLADSIRNLAPSMDLLARLEGDRFAALLVGVTRDDALAMCERLRAGMAARSFALRGHITTQITASLGLAYDVRDLDDGVARASAALGRAKDRGGNAVEPNPA